MRGSGDLVAWWCHDPTRDRAPGLRYESLGYYDQLINRIVELRKRAGRSSKSRRSSTGKGITPQYPGGLHEHVGAEALVSLRADPWEDRDQATRSPRVVVAGLGPVRFKCQWTSSRIWAIRGWVAAAGPAARSVGRLGRWAGTTPTVEAHGRLAFEQVCGTNIVMKKVISFEILIPYIHSTWIGDQAL